MPVTFLAHQAPVLPVARRWPSRLDGVALVVGSMAPDLAYVLAGSRWSVWAHAWPGLVTFCVPVTAVLTLLIRRRLAPVVPAHLPRVADLRLRDLRGLAARRVTIGPLVAGALLGAASHVALDSFTHEWGWFARNIDVYTDPLLDEPFLGRVWTPYRVLQYAGHVVGIGITLWILRRWGRERWLAQRAAPVPAIADARSHLVLWTATALGGVGAGAWVLADRNGSAVDVIRVSAGTFVGLWIGAELARASTSDRRSRRGATHGSAR